MAYPFQQSIRSVYKPRLHTISWLNNSSYADSISGAIIYGLLSIDSLIFISALIHQWLMPAVDKSSLIWESSSFLIIGSLLWLARRAGWQRLAKVGLLGLLWATALHVTLRWSFALPIGELLYAVLILVAVIVLSPKTALLFSGIVAVSLFAISYAQIAHHLHPDINWRQMDIQVGDATTYAALLCLIALAAWLTNRELHRTLKRALVSEAALAKQRDSLEIEVSQRTAALETAQRLRLSELQRFAKFGQIQANLLHEIANPLTAAKLYLQLCDRNAQPYLAPIEASLQQLDRFSQLARRQISDDELSERFSVNRELLIIKQIMQPIASKANIKLTIDEATDYQLQGDAIKFNQIVTNLISNAIGACQTSQQTEKTIRVELSLENDYLKLSVADNGCGMSAKQRTQLFTNFYTTKSQQSRGLGLGLAFIKQIVEAGFNGYLTVESQLHVGSCFSIYLPMNVRILTHTLNANAII